MNEKDVLDGLKFIAQTNRAIHEHRINREFHLFITAFSTIILTDVAHFSNLLPSRLK